MQNQTRILLGGAPEGFDARLVARELAKGQPVIHIARDDKRAEAMKLALAVMAPGAVVLDLPAWDCLPYDRVSPVGDIVARRGRVAEALVLWQKALKGEDEEGELDRPRVEAKVREAQGTLQAQQQPIAPPTP